jgi:hypothetical protein
VTEAEWLACTDPTPMLDYVQGQVSERKLRLFACACARVVWDRLPAGLMRDAVETAERYADGLATDQERQSFAHRLYSQPAEQFAGAGGNQFTEDRENVSAYGLALLTVNHMRILSRMPITTGWMMSRLATGDRRPHLLRDVVGDPFRPVAADPAWPTPNIVATAQAIYADRAFDLLPTLADALEDAGCDQPDLLAHCRGDGPHVRGCWAIDLLLGKG